jgi:hypothetical protein
MTISRKVFSWSLGILVVVVGVALWLFYRNVGSKPAGVPLDSSAVIDSSGAGQDTTTETKILIKDG